MQTIPTNQTDQELYNKFLSGNKEAFNTIIKKYREPLIFFVRKYGINLESAEDIVHDSFIYVLVNKKEYDFKYTFKTYLYTVAKCRAFNYLKRNKRIVVLNEQYVSSTTIQEVDIEQELIESEEKEQVHNAIKKLKREYQVVIYLKDFQKFQHKEIAKILNKTIPQTKMLLHRARKALDKKLREEGEIC